jgi:hypothetical protein
MRKSFVIAAAVVSLVATPAYADTWTIGDNDGYGAGIPDGGDHPFNGFTANYDGRSAAEMIATDGAQYTDTYSTTHPGYGPQPGTVATFIFAGLGNGWTAGAMTFDLADFQASTFGAVLVNYNGIAQNWAFNDGFPHTAIHSFDFAQDVIDSINTVGSLTVTIDRNGSSDFYGIDYAQLSDQFVVQPSVPEPSTWAMMLIGFGAVGFGMRRRKQTKLTFRPAAA